MKVLVALEDRAGGMMFNHRRLSRDRVMNADIVADLKGKTLFISPYSEMLFSDFGISLDVAEDFLDRVAEGTAFVEDRHLMPYLDKITELVIYRWGRKYPSDFTFDLDLSAFTLTSVSEFSGSSHEKITKEVYVK